MAPGGVVAFFEEAEGDEVGGDGDGDGDENGAEDEGEADGEEGGPVEPDGDALVEVGVGVGLAEDEGAEPVFPMEEDGGEGEDDVVEGDGDGGGDEVAAGEFRDADGEEGFEAEEGDEAEEGAAGDAEGDGVGFVAELGEAGDFVTEPADDFSDHGWW